jgi:hypothetical protein
MNKKRSADYTNYPAIFSKSYWGAGDMIINNTKDDQIIGANRNKFVETYKIKKYYSSGRINVF